ncbi:MAG: hypothetical protein QUS09_09545 [Methanotrichaceae archaeon]|nr:hypothetical protein [Methanotrichaceae archaeon]
MQPSRKACPFVARECLAEGCLAWGEAGCRLIPRTVESTGPFDQKLQSAAPLMYRTLLDLVKVLEETSRDCPKCGPDLWNYAQEVRAYLLDDLIKAELAEVGIRGNRKDQMKES